MKEVYLRFIFRKNKVWRQKLKFFLLMMILRLDVFVPSSYRKRLRSFFIRPLLNGAKACIAEAHPDIIVLDVEIGNQNGIEVAPEITVIAPNVPVLFISSHTESHWVVQALGSGCGGLS